MYLLQLMNGLVAAFLVDLRGMGGSCHCHCWRVYLVREKSVQMEKLHSVVAAEGVVEVGVTGAARPRPQGSHFPHTQAHSSP
jgi:hypothetical protein